MRTRNRILLLVVTLLVTTSAVGAVAQKGLAWGGAQIKQNTCGVDLILPKETPNGAWWEHADATDETTNQKVVLFDASNLSSQFAHPNLSVGLSTPTADVYSVTFSVANAANHSDGLVTYNEEIQNCAGTPGPEGPPGQNGTNGCNANVQVGTTTTLPAGSPATVTNTGTGCNAILNFGIPKGETGSGGEPPCMPAFSILSTNTLSPGSPATASLTSTGTCSWGLSLGIPKGETGNQGPRGKTGKTGKPGKCKCKCKTKKKHVTARHTLAVRRDHPGTNA